MPVNYNTSLLQKLNSVRLGNTESFTIGYSIADSAFKSISNGGLLSKKLTESQLRNDVQSALTFWANLLNTIYKSNKKVKGNLKCKLVNDTKSENDFNVKISTKNLKSDIALNRGGIVLNSNLSWKSLSFESGLDVFAYVIYGVGKLLGLSESYVSESVMNKQNLKINYISHYSLKYDASGIILYPDSIADAGTIKNIKTKYGSMLYSYPIVYGCINPNADNYNKEATRSDGSCIYTKKSSPTVYKSTINKY